MNLEALNQIPEIWDQLSEPEKRQILAELDAIEDELMEWSPLPGPQTLAYHSKAKILFYGGSAGSGKGISLDTELATVSGFKLMGDINIGDKVFDEDGKLCNVIAVSAINNRRVFKIIFDDGSTIKADDVHRWFTLTDAERTANFRLTDDFRNKRKSTRLSRAKALSKKPWVSALITARNKAKIHAYKSPINGNIRTTIDIFNTLRVGLVNRANHSIALAKPLDLPLIDLPIDPYVLGAWLGDGGKHGGGFTCAEQELIDHIENAGFITRKRKSIYAYGILNLQKLLRENNLIKNKHIPPIYLRASIEQRKELLRGLLDTDGHASKRGYIELAFSDKTLIDGAYELVASLGIKATITVKKTTRKDSHRLKFVCPFPAFKLKRKLERQKLNGFRDTTVRRYIVDVQEISSEPTKCIAVDSPSRQYLVGKSFIPTHNTDLIIGLAKNAHQHSIIFRREYKQLRGIVERGKELIDKLNKGKFNKVDYVFRLNDGRTIELGACKDLGDEEKFQGIPHDLKAFDEITHFQESQFRFLSGWLRNVNKQQHTRIVCTGNPPTTSEGDWVIKYWAPWLDDKHKNPAAPGELRWFTTIDGKEVELLTGDIIHHNGEIITPESRTFIPGRVDDNPYLIEAGYKARLQALPEPLRSKMLFGDFKAGREDDSWQIIPTEWVRIAQARWESRPKPEMLMTALGVDVARGGRDQTILSPRYGNYYDIQKVFPGSSTPDGNAVATLAVQNADRTTIINVDVIGVGTSVYDILNSNKVNINAINGAAHSDEYDHSGMLGFVNKRAELYWKFRESLDPKNGDDICLPPGNELLADLCAPRWKLTVRGIQVESKEDIIKRLGRSPDHADSIIYASEAGLPALTMFTLR